MELACELRRMRDVLAETRLLIGDYDLIIEHTELSLTPAEGWPGKNEAESKVSQARVYAEYPPLREYRNNRSGHISIAERLEASIQSARDELRAWELSIQDNLTAVLGGVFAFAYAAQLAGKQAAKIKPRSKKMSLSRLNPNRTQTGPEAGFRYRTTRLRIATAVIFAIPIWTSIICPVRISRLRRVIVR
jgi:hypothetical protein